MPESKLVYNLISGGLISLIIVYTIINISSLSSLNKNKRNVHKISIVGCSLFIISSIIGLIIWTIHH